MATTNQRAVSKALVKLAVEDWHRRVGNRRYLLSDTLQYAMLAEVIIQMMRQRDDTNSPIGAFVDLYDATFKVLFPD